jgi:hypothetical protein
MTVGEAGSEDGSLREVTREFALDTDTPIIEFSEHKGIINSDLTVGVDITAAVPLKANEGVCAPGVKLHGAGFIVTPDEAAHLGLGKRMGLDKHIRNYRNGRDLMGRPRGVLVIDLFGVDEESADSDEAGQAFQYEAGHPFRDEAGHGSDLKPATWRSLRGSGG